MALPLPNLGVRSRKILRYVGYVVLALVSFVFALQLTFPYDRVRDKIVEALSAKYDVTIPSVDRGWLPGRVYFKNVSLRTRPATANDPVNTLFIQQLQVDLGLLALIGQTASVDVDATIAGGHLAGNISLSKTATEVHIEGTNLPAQGLPMREVLGLPMSGLLQLSFHLDLPSERTKTGRIVQSWTKANGAIQFSCAVCTFGDGKTKLKPKLKNSRNQAFAADGIEFGKVNVTSMMARVEIKDGSLALKKFDTKSDDGEVKVEYSMTLTDQFAESAVAGCLRFRGNDTLLKREPKTFAAISTTGAPLGPDGLYHIRLDGRFKDMKRLPQLCGPGISEKNIDSPPGGGPPSRPNLTVQPDEPIRASGGTPPTSFTPPPPTAPTPPDGGTDAGTGTTVPAPVPMPEQPGAPAEGSAGSFSGSGVGSGVGVGSGSGLPPPAPPPMGDIPSPVTDSGR